MHFLRGRHRPPRLAHLSARPQAACPVTNRTHAGALRGRVQAKDPLCLSHASGHRGEKGTNRGRHRHTPLACSRRLAHEQRLRIAGNEHREIGDEAREPFRMQSFQTSRCLLRLKLRGLTASCITQRFLTLEVSSSCGVKKSGPILVLLRFRPHSLLSSLSTHSSLPPAKLGALAVDDSSGLMSDPGTAYS